MSEAEKGACLAFNSESGCPHGEECWFKHVKVSKEEIKAMKIQKAEKEAAKIEFRNKKKQERAAAKAITQKEPDQPKAAKGKKAAVKKVSAVPETSPALPAKAYERVINGTIIAQATNTINKAMVAMDLGNGELFAACFTEDAEVTVATINSTSTGRIEIAALGVALHNKFSTCRHWEGNVSLWPGIEKNTLRNVSYWQALEGAKVKGTGIHEDVLINVRGQWLIKKRKILHTFSSAGTSNDPGQTPL